MPRLVRHFTLILLALFLVSLGAVAQIQLALQPGSKPASAPGANPSPSDKPATEKPAVTPIPLAEIASRAESAAASLKGIESDSASEDSVARIETSLPATSAEIEAQLAEDARALKEIPSLDALRSLEADWQKVSADLRSWELQLRTSASKIDKQIANLLEQEETWKQTLALAQSSEGAPPELSARITTLIGEFSQTRSRLEKRRAQTLALQNRIVQQETLVNGALSSLKQAREEAVSRVLVRDSSPIWNTDVIARDWRALTAQGRASVATQFAEFRSYAGRNIPRLILHLLVVLLLIGVFRWVRRRIEPWLEEEPGLKRAAPIFDLRVGPAFVISILAGHWIYPQAPRLWYAVLGAIAIIPITVIIRRLVERRVAPVLNALLVFYFVDLLRTVATSLPLTSRLLLLAEMLGGVVFLSWQIKSSRSSVEPNGERSGLRKRIEVFVRIALGFFVVSLLANALGYVTLATVSAAAILGSAYFAALLYAGKTIFYGLLVFTLRSRPSNWLRMFSDNREMFRRRSRKTLNALAFLIWLNFTLESLSLRLPLIQGVQYVLEAQFGIGSLTLTVGNLVAFGLVIWVAFLISRLVRFVLDEDVFPRVGLPRGTPYAISTALNYVILLIGFLVAIAALGIDMTKFTILAGAFGLGLGFGLQNIINNFVSGLIVLFERPVKVGDIVQTTEATGVVKRIGVRASVISAANGADVIVPNGKLISDSVINWTLLSYRRGLTIKVGTKYGTNPSRVIALLKEIAHAHELVVDNPEPVALLTEFGPDSLNFELRAWTNHFDKWELIRSDLAVAIESTFAAEKIEIPYQQRDLHLRSVDNSLLEALTSQSNAESNGSPVQTNAQKTADKMPGSAEKVDATTQR
jgi:potassium-dependent mechanosensitive channel